MGLQPVEIMAGDTVAAVEVLLDGELNARLIGPPWSLVVDLGPELAPHTLEAVAFDAAGKEMGRALQWINMSPEPARTSILIDGAKDGRGGIARLNWESLTADGNPRSVEAYFDGQRIDADNLRTITLPDFDPELAHHLRVRLEFTDLIASEAEAILGGAIGEQVNAEISAVPIVSKKGKVPDSLASMKGWFLVGGEPQTVHAVEKGPIEVTIVRDIAVQSSLREMEIHQRFLRRKMPLYKGIVLKDNYRVQFVSPCPRLIQRENFEQWVFPRSARYSAEELDLTDLLAKVVPKDCTADRQQIADAVAVAGLAANQHGLRRVVVLMVSGLSPDHSQYSPAQVGAYLAKLRVPLLVWAPSSSKGLETEWGRATDAHDKTRFRIAFDLLEKEVEQQSIVWLEGLHLPQAIELHPEVKGVSLVD